MTDFSQITGDVPAEFRELRDNVHRFAAERMRPVAIALDRLADPQEVIAHDSPLWDFLREAYSLGYHKAGIPTRYGGMGLSGLGMQVFLEELGWGAADLALCLGVAGFPFGALAAFGNEELIEEYLKPYTEDREARFIGCWPITEPLHGSDWAMGVLNPSARIVGQVTARRDGDSYVINGQKSAWVSNGTIATHSLTVLTADPKLGMAAGRGVAFVPLDLPGISKGKPLNKLGQRALNQGEIFFDEVRIPDRFMLAAPDKAPGTGGMSPGGPNASMSASFTGVARSALEVALEYAKQRVQGGRPICQHQLVQKRLFEMFTKVEASRDLSRQAMTATPTNTQRAVALAIAAKTFCTEAAFEVASDALQIFGGNGLSREYPIEKIFRDARAALIEDGTNEVLSLVGAQMVISQV